MLSANHVTYDQSDVRKLITQLYLKSLKVYRKVHTLLKHAYIVPWNCFETR